MTDKTTAMTELPEPELGYIETDKSRQPAFSARQMREALRPQADPIGLDVEAMIKAVLPGQKEASTTKCTPWLGLTSALTGTWPAQGCKTICRRASTQTPVALTTQRACRVDVWPSRSLNKVTCQPWAEGAKAVTRMWLCTQAPAARAVLAAVDLACFTASTAICFAPSHWKQTVPRVRLKL